MKRGIREWLLFILLCMGLMGFPAGVRAQTALSLPQDAARVEEPYLVQNLADLYQEGMLKIDDEMKLTSVKLVPEEKGILLTGKGTDLASGRLSIQKIFDFDQNMVGRITLDGVVSVRTDLSVQVFLDGGSRPAASIPLKKQKRAGRWSISGDVTLDVLAEKIAGKHSVSLGFATEAKGEISVLLRSIEFVEDSLPVLYFHIDESQGLIDAMNHDSQHDTECYGSVTVQIPPGYRSEYTDQVLQTETYDLEYIRGRGNSTWGEDKKPYKIKLDKKADLFGMGKNKHWVLLANRFDNSKLRNKMTYWLGSALGMPYTPESVPVDVVMNGTYYGSYYLSEQVRIGKSRVEIDDLEDSEELKNSSAPEIISGGYLLSLEPYGDEKNRRFTTGQGVNVLIERPSFEDYFNESQFNYIRDYVQHTEDAIYGEDFKDAAGMGYAEWMDVDAAVDYYWMQELSMNGDGFISTSTYLYKPRGGKLYWGPLWDFDYVAWGSYDYSSEPMTEEFMHRNSIWFDRLLDDEVFARKVVDRWPAIRNKLTELIREGGQLDKYYKQLIVSDRYDYEKWGAYNFEQGTPLTLKEEETRLKDWIRARMDWIDDNVSTLIPEKHKITYKVDGKVFTRQTFIESRGITSLPEPPKKKGLVFEGWHIKDQGADIKLYNGFFTDHDLTAKAVWIPKNQEIKPEKLYFLYNRMTLTLYDEDYLLPYTILPGEVTDDRITFTSSDPGVATVSELGSVTPVKPGKTTITGTCSNGIRKSVKVTVIDPENTDFNFPDRLDLNYTSLSLKEGQSRKLTPTMEPQPCVNGYVRWIVSDPEIAYITEAGLVTGLKAGSTTIVAFNPETELYTSCYVTVKKPAGTAGKVKKGQKYTVSGLRYKVTKTGTKGTVTCIGRAKKSLKSVRIPNRVCIKGRCYKVTAIGAGAFKKTKITSVTLGDNLKKIGKGAFKDCRKLTTIKVKAKRYKAYKKLLKPSTGFKAGRMKLKKTAK